MERIKEIFVKIKKGHSLWLKGDIAYNSRLEKAFQPFFNELEQLGVDRVFSESLLFFGKEFVDSFSSDRKPTEDNGRLSEDSRRLDQAGLPVTVGEAEKIFETKAVDATDREIRESKLAKKNNAFVYRSEPMKGDSVGIKILSKIDS